MSKALELSNALDMHWIDHSRCHPNDTPMCESAAAELRRLAQVEAEHAELKKWLEAEREETRRWVERAHSERGARVTIEADHEALLKAISDAEPVAWYEPAIDGRSVAYFDGRPMLMVGAIGNEHHTAPLYTLNGIKK